jgi:short-subunit dehydrogenase
VSFHGSAAYHATKHAVVALSEKLYYDLAAREAKIKVSVLCPIPSSPPMCKRGWRPSSRGGIR